MQKLFRKIFLLCFLLSGVIAFAQDHTKDIENVLRKQADAWNNFDLEGFMDGYWKSDSLKFVSRNGVTYGWQKVFDNYKKTYDSKEKMGVLTFSELKFEPLGQEQQKKSAFPVYMIIGKWQVQQAEKTIGGYFTLIFKHINGAWKITTDHTS